MDQLSSFQRDLLYIIAGVESPRGAKIKEDLEEYYGSNINDGRLYPNLDQLAGQGLVNKQPVNDRANSYSLTSKAIQLIWTRRKWENSRPANGAEDEHVEATVGVK